ncbi:cytochrome P450 [Obba rivulosa]|uniref:Cytochrome P450 n=1 Tax=Obba rivulosa TaxID=1052685 RepID=A0A8E2AWX6_9APHY|nr:cytochrome P450 [Obba rivulosa]
MTDRFLAPALLDVRRIIQILDRVSKQVFKEKKAALLGQVYQITTNGARISGDLADRIKGKDIMSIMLEANVCSDDTDRLSDAELLGQINFISTIVFAGLETTTIAIHRILYILASKPDVQARLRTEIRKAKSSIRYLMGLQFLNAVVRETLRVYPPTSLMTRTSHAVLAHRLPLQFPVRSTTGVLISEIPLLENTTGIISLLASNHNKEVWGGGASEWRPERWNTAAFARGKMGMVSRLSAMFLPRAHWEPHVLIRVSRMTFLDGGRACIGLRFAEMETSETNEHGRTKQILWKMNGLHVPVDPPPRDGHTPQVPLDIRRVCEEDFS